ncbi:tripartite tricarboxylate transporter substrate binding protein [Pigmentiphaga soli]|uniref:Tripartite tricarboxylate transporter substrate binding protein n=1 Tax=Pigmentiphaga soli TaxID=1007095 RepID=A0ABP8H276_9BURK
MNESRRSVLGALAGSAALLGGSGILPAAAAQAYPNRTVRLVVAWPPGSSTDTSARILAQKMGEALGQTFVVENRAGASGIIGAESVARSAPDGYTLLFNTSNQASNKLAFAKLPYDPITDFAPICRGYRNVLVLVAHPSLPARNFAEFLDYAKKSPGKLSFGSPGVGTPHQLAGELLKQVADIEIEHVPYKGGGPAAVDLISGQIPLAIASLVAVLPNIRSGQIRALAITEKARYAELPEVPTIAETFPGFDVSGWGGMFAPAGTPAPIVRTLNAEMARALRRGDVSQTMNGNGLVPWPSTPDELAQLVRDDIDRWTAVARSGVKFS